MIPLSCPSCNLQLERYDRRLACACGATFDIVDDIPVLTRSAKYYGEISLERKRALLDQMDQGQHWRTLVWNAFGTSYPFLHHIIVDEARNDFRYVLPHNPEGIVLDLGAGWGTMCTHFAHDYRRVVAMDGTLDRCQFIQKRCRQDRIDNVECICANILESPLPENYFDIVLMNGVLEWIGESSPEGDPEALQIKALETVKRILKPHGALYVGIENSHGFKYILGEPDDHSGLPHITYLLRPKADEKARKDLKRPYRTYTYDRRGYARLLSAAGFQNADYYYPAPDYKSVNALIPLDRDNVLDYYNREQKPASHPNSVVERVRSLELFATERGHVSDYVASYSIVAGRPDRPSVTHAISDYVKAHWQGLLPRKPDSVDVLQLSAATGKKYERGRVKFLLFADGEPYPLLTAVFSRAREYDDSLHKEAELYRLPLWDGFPARIPRVAAFDTILGFPVLFRHAWRGRTMNARLAQVRYSPEFTPERLQQAVGEDLRAARSCLQGLHCRTRRPGSHSSPDFIARVFEKAAAIWECGVFPNLERLQPIVSDYYGDKEDCILHGDFVPSNILFLENGAERIGLIDWELSLVNGITVLDYCRFVFYYAVLLEELQTEFGNREEVLKEIFFGRKTWLGAAFMQFLEADIPEFGTEPKLGLRLMQFSLLYDALLQCDHSAHPALKLGRNFAKIYALFD